MVPPRLNLSQTGRAELWEMTTQLLEHFWYVLIEYGLHIQKRVPRGHVQRNEDLVKMATRAKVDTYM